MNIGDFLKDLKLDVWYKAFLYIGGVALILSFFLDVKGITNTQLQFIAGGIFLIGIGEWKNHKDNLLVKPPNAYTGGVAYFKATIWQPDIIGLLLDLIGLALVIWGFYSIMNPSPIINPINIPTPTSLFTLTPLPTETLMPITP